MGHQLAQPCFKHYRGKWGQQIASQDSTNTRMQGSLWELGRGSEATKAERHRASEGGKVNIWDERAVTEAMNATKEQGKSENTGTVTHVSSTANKGGPSYSKHSF